MNTSRDASIENVLKYMNLTQPLLAEIFSHITDVVDQLKLGYQRAVAVEIEDSDPETDPLPNYRTLSNGKRIGIHPPNDAFILKHTTRDVLEAVEQHARRGLSTVLLFHKKRYAMAPMRFFHMGPMSSAVN